jgi:glucose-6-phosphate 1-dehydrogenase
MQLGSIGLGRMGSNKARTCAYKRGTWGPKEANALIATDGCWHNPMPERGRA